MIPKNYYASKTWILFSKSILDDKECICEICKRPRWKLLVRGKNKGKWKRLLRFAIHHKHYNSVYKESREDVIALCSFCHTTAHNALRSRNASNFHEKLAKLFEESGFVYNKD
jgi:hypothetical protein